MQQITIDPQFRDLIPPLSADERAQLERNLIADGCREPLVVWRDGETVTLIDGHNRYEICTRNGIKFDTVDTAFPSRDEAVLWIAENQFGRRNITDFVKAELALVIKPIIAAKAKEQQVRKPTDSVSQNFGKQTPVHTDVEVAKKAGISKENVRKVEKIKETATPELLTAVRSGDISINTAADIATLAPAKQVAVVESGTTLEAAKQIRLEKAETRRAENAEIASRGVTWPDGKYGTIVIDPPWPMEKIERDVAPNQVAFEYPVMSEQELRDFGIKVNEHAADDCHMFMWTTHKFLPMSLRLLEAWGYKYVLTMVWHKSGGFQPFNLPQYNCEFAIYARRGAPKFVDTKAFNVCFNAPRREHSRKPDEFYDLIRRVTADGRIDIFSREARDGFAQLGNEAEKFKGVA